MEASEIPSRPSHIAFSGSLMRVELPNNASPTHAQQAAWYIERGAKCQKIGSGQIFDAYSLANVFKNSSSD